MELLIHRFRLLRFAAACGLTVCAATAHAQLLEFTGAELRGRIDHPSPDNMWTVGDNNGNGTVDDNEQFVTRIDIADAFLEQPGRAYFAYRRGALVPISLTRANADLIAGPFQPGGIVDDIDSDGQFGPVGFDFEDPGSEPDTLSLNNRGDFNDLVILPTPFYFIGRDAYARFGGAQLMNVLRFEGDPRFSLTAANESLELAYGIRFLAGMQDYYLSTGGGLLGSLAVNSTLESESLGPQISVRWSVGQGRWHARAEAAAAVTYMNLDGDQVAQIGEDPVLGQHNHPLYFEPNHTGSQLEMWDVAPVIEAGLLASYDLAPSTVCFIRCDAIQFGNIRSVEQSVVYQLPAMGLRDPGGSDVTITSASIGLELRR